MTNNSNTFSISYKGNYEPIQQQSFWSTPINDPLLNAMGMEVTPRMVAGTFAALPPLLAADKFINNKIGGETDKSLLKKIADFGDKISAKLDKDGKKTAKVTEFFNNNRFFKYFSDKYSTIPRNSLVQPIVNPELHTPSELAKYLSSLKNSSEYSYLFGNGTNALSQETKNYLMNLNPENVTQDTKKLTKATDEVIKKGVDTIKKDSLIPGTIKLSYLNNKIKSGEAAFAKTPLGSLFARGALNLKNNFTFLGGLFGFLFVSYTLNETAEETAKAPEGEKISTAAHILATDFGGMLAIQAGTGFLYKLAGNKYRGLSLDARKEIENIIQTANNNEAITKEEIEVAKLQRDMLFKGAKIEDVRTLKGKNLETAKKMAEKFDCKLDLKFWEKPLKYFGRFLGTGLDEIQKTKFTIPILDKKLKPTFKGLSGGAGRFLIATVAILPAVHEPLTKLTHKIFGKPETYLKKEENAMNGTSEENDTETPVITSDFTQQSNPAPIVNPQQLADTNMLKKFASKPTTQQKEQAIAASSLKTNRIDTATYIPSISVDNSYLQLQEQHLNNRVNEILKKSDSTVSRLSKSLNN